MSAVIEDRTTTCLLRALALVAWLLLPGVTAQQADDDPLAAARAALAEGTAPDSVLAVHAGSLAQAGDLETLAGHLAGGPPPVVAAVLGAVQAHAVVGLLPELVSVAAEAADNGLRLQASAHLEDLVLAHPSVRSDLSGFLHDPERPAAHRRQVVVLLGKGRDLSVVEHLLPELDGPLAPAASEALARLSGHPQPPLEEAPGAWRAFWEEHAGLTREELLELGLTSERQRAGREAQRLQGQVERLHGQLVQARLTVMDDDIERLIAGLADEYTAVRLEAARRLGDHAAREQARAALPVLLERLGATGVGDGGTNGHDQAPPEADVSVRAAIVTALGNLGQDRPEVRRCLLDQVHASEVLVAQAAVDALVNVRDQPDVVVPLLDGLDQRAPDDATLVKVLRIVRANQPQGVLDDLRPYLAEERPEEVRRWAVRAVLASAELGLALDEVVRAGSAEGPLLVRFALASGVGEAARGLAPDAPERGTILELLAALLNDPEASVRAEAASSLGESGDAGALALLTERARQEIDGSVLLAIVVALGDLGDQRAVEAIGRIAASEIVDDGPALSERTQQALLSIGSAAPPSAWFAMAETLRGVGATDLALFAVNDVLFPTREGVGADAAVADRARGLKVYLLQDKGRHDEARDLLLQIQEAGGPAPPPGEREELLARSCSALGLADEAADWWTLRLAALDEGDARLVAIRRELAQALMTADRHDEALEQLLALSEALPEDNQVMLWIGKVRMAKGQDDDARQVFARLLERLTDPADPIRLEAEQQLVQLTPPAEEPAPDPADDEAEDSGGPTEPAVDDGQQGTEPEVGRT